MNEFEIDIDDSFKEQLLYWADTRPTFCFLESNRNQNKNDQFSKYDLIVGVDHERFIELGENPFNSFQLFHEEKQEWIMGYLGYDLKNSIENINSKNPNKSEFPDGFFFSPKILFLINGNTCSVKSCLDKMEINSILGKIKSTLKKINVVSEPVNIKQGTSKDNYLKHVETILDHIKRGNIYEINYCIDFFSEGTKINPLKIFSNLNKASMAPMSGILKFKNKYIISSSPERFLQRNKTYVLSQPIKGTAPRDKDKIRDKILLEKLSGSLKEKTENVMIVDLVRNDLSKIKDVKSVEATELFGIYSFNQVHQMISTVKATIPEEIKPLEIIRATFPMGSMTGAPKMSAMQIADELETFRRGPYSGSMGYFDPENNFDLNVLIRSIFYNSDSGYLYFGAGSAITFNSDPEEEYKECLLKAEAMKGVLLNGND